MHVLHIQAKYMHEKNMHAKIKRKQYNKLNGNNKNTSFK